MAIVIDGYTFEDLNDWWVIFFSIIYVITSVSITNRIRNGK